MTCGGPVGGTPGARCPASVEWARGDLNLGEHMFHPSVWYHPVWPDLHVHGYVVVDGAGENLWMLNRPVEIR